MGVISKLPHGLLERKEVSVASPSPAISRHAIALVAGVVALIVGATYGLSLDHDVGFWDTGELQTVPYILGLAHPTGYPAEILLGWVFTHAFPFGEPSLRMNVFCMLCVVIATVCACATAILLGARPLIAAAAGVCFACTPVVWGHATHADVTDPAIALCAMALLCAVLAVVRDEPRMLLGGAVCAGAALGTHGIVVWFLPLPLLFVLLSANVRLARGLAASAFVVGAVALLEYAYLPLRSRVVTDERLDPTRALGMPPGMPFWDQGHPATWHGFLTIITGSPVHAPASLTAVLEPSQYLHDLAFGLQQLHANYPWPVMFATSLLAIVAVWTAPRNLALVLPAALVTPFAASFGAESDVSRYFTFPLLCLWVLAALGLTKLAQTQGARAVAPLALAAFAVFEVYANRGFFGQRTDALGRTYIAEVLAATDPRAVVIAPWVYATPLAYAEYVDHSMAGRVLVAATVEDVTGSLPRWVGERPVYVIAEGTPRVPLAVTLVRALGVNPDAMHDPKLFRLRYQTPTPSASLRGENRNTAAFENGSLHDTVKNERGF